MILNNFFTLNRQRLLTETKNGLIVLSAYTSIQKQNDMASPFQQEGNFWYLTGIEQPDWLVIIDGIGAEEWLVMPNVDTMHEMFDGSLSAEEAVQTSGIKKVISHDESILLLRKLAKKHSIVYTTDNPAYSDRYNFALNPAISANKKMLERVFTSVVDCSNELNKLRAIKQPEEIKAIEKAVRLTGNAFTSVRSKLVDLRYEYEIEAEFDYHFKRHGFNHAYDPIVAAGKNACTLHYIANKQRLKTGSLVLIDVGARVNGYAADITRTYAYGEPTKRQKDVHAKVATAHQAIIELLEPNLGVEDYQRNVMRIMGQAVAELGLVSSPEDEGVFKYFPHAVSHGLGLDVHDSLGKPRYFEPGMVLTVEPGIYIPEESIGVRIEDDVLITEKGHRNLSRRLSTDL